jgi:hypothetical protein
MKEKAFILRTGWRSLKLATNGSQLYLVADLESQIIKLVIT